MRGFVYSRGGSAGQALTRISVILCVLVTAFLFAPRLGLFTRNVSTPVSISPISHNNAILPVLVRTGDNLCAAKTRNDTFGKRTLAPDAIASWSVPYLSANFCGLAHYVSSFNSIFIKDFRQVCQILDIPPPSSAATL